MGPIRWLIGLDEFGHFWTATMNDLALDVQLDRVERSRRGWDSSFLRLGAVLSGDEWPRRKCGFGVEKEIAGVSATWVHHVCNVTGPEVVK